MISIVWKVNITTDTVMAPKQLKYLSIKYFWYSHESIWNTFQIFIYHFCVQLTWCTTSGPTCTTAFVLFLIFASIHHATKFYIVELAISGFIKLGKGCGNLFWNRIFYIFIEKWVLSTFICPSSFILLTIFSCCLQRIQYDACNAKTFAHELT